MNKTISIFHIILLSSLSWSLLIIGHEILGHGLGALIVGGTPISVDAMSLSYDVSEATFWQKKFVTANGSFINIIFIIIAVLWISRLKNKSTWLGYFLWLTIMMNCFQSGNYIAFGKFIHPRMDWGAKIFDKLEPALFWEILVMSIGVLLIIVGFYFGRKHHYFFINSKSSLIKQRFKIFVLPLIIATMLSVIAAFIMPTDDRLLMVWGGFGNSFFFLTGMLILAFIPTKKLKIIDSVTLKSNSILLIISILITSFYLFLMSPGFSFNL